MGEIPWHQKPSSRSVVLAILLGGIFIYDLVWGGGLWKNALGIALDLILVFLLLQACVFFYAQFVLPIHTLQERRKIADRLWLHAGHSHGPAIFVKNGREVERAGESDRRGPGVLWLDTASAVVTRTFATFKQVLGPGVHFIDANERIAGAFSLHTQTQTVGPTAFDRPFEKLKDNPTEEERARHEETRARCFSVRGITRDGIEVIPNITVTFKLDARPASAGEKGSRFGFDAAAVERAARSEGINPDSVDEQDRRVPWNQLPALMAVELWREYLSKFTLTELFDPSLAPLPVVPQPEMPPPAAPMPKYPLLAKRGFLARILRNVNNSLERRLDQFIPKEESPVESEIAGETAAPPRTPGEAPRQTALQTINQMIKARLANAVVPALDEFGRIMEGHELSDEYKKLKDRGIAVLGVSLGRLQFSAAVEAQLVERFTTTWLSNARTERARLERLSLAYTENARQKAALDHAAALGEALLKEKPADASAAVRCLVRRTEAELKANDRLLGRLGQELEALDDLARWAEAREL